MFIRLFVAAKSWSVSFFQNCIRDNQNFVCLFATIRPFVIAIKYIYM